MNNCFILLAAGKGKRFNSNRPKQFEYYKNKPLFMHSLEKAVRSKLFKKIILVINKKHKKNVNLNIKVIDGGNKRQDSCMNALKYLNNKKIKNVFIHDAARPNLSINLLKRLNRNLKKNKCVVPYTESQNSVKYQYLNKIYNLKRENVYLTQTPQCFNFKTLFNLAKKNKGLITDECSLFLKNNLKVKFIKGEVSNRKITYKKDIKTNKINFGIGFDVHRLVPNRNLYLGGLKIKSKLGTLGHSDGDPVLHAIIDAILGACRKGDIGQKFSDKNKKFKNIRSTILLKKIINEIKLEDYFINNLDVNIITQTPKISKYKNKIIKSISDICEISPNQINIKGKTTEKLGLIGKEKAIACEVITSVSKYD